MRKKVRTYLIALLSALCAVLVACGLFFTPKGLSATAESVPVTGTATSVEGKVSLESFSMLSGASVKKTGKRNGMRFTTQISVDDLAKLPDNAQFGTLILPEHMLTAGQLTRNTENVLDIKAEVWKNSSTDTMKEFTGVLVDYPEEYYTTKMLARAYVTYTDKSGEEYTVYAKNAQTRDLAYVVSAALDAGESGELLTSVMDSVATSFGFESSSVSVAVGVPYTLTPAEGSGQGLLVQYESSDENIVRINETGVLLGIKPGKATVTATMNGRKATVSVTVLGSGESAETLPVWSDLSDSSIIVNSSCWTITPTEAELAAVGAVSGATYRGIQGNANNFAYSGMKVLPADTDSAYWEAYADYTLKFDWYYDLTTDGSDGVQYAVSVFGATKAFFEQCTWHTASVKVGDLLEAWSETTSTSLASSDSVTRWLKFAWASGVSDAYAGFAYFGNIRLEEPALEWSTLGTGATLNSVNTAVISNRNHWSSAHIVRNGLASGSEVAAIGGTGAFEKITFSSDTTSKFRLYPIHEESYYTELNASGTYEVVFDWYYDLEGDTNNVPCTVSVYGTTATSNAQDTLHTERIPLASLLAEGWSTLTDTSYSSFVGTAWLNFQWTQAFINAGSSVTLYIGNVRIESAADDETATPDSVSATIWTADGTQKFLQNQSYSGLYSNTTLTYGAFRNETESAQIMITPTQDISWYSVIVSNLTNENGKTLSAKNFEVFHQKYVEVAEVTTTETTTVLKGKYPDALIPIAAAANYKETAIASGNNQGVWITLSVLSDQEAGEYTGTFIVVLDGVTFEVPVSVTVYDYTLEDTYQSQTRFGLSWDSVEYAEGLYGGELSEELQRAYYEGMLDMGVSLSVLPGISGNFYFDYNGTYDPTADVFADDFAFTYGGDGYGYYKTVSGEMADYVEEVATYTQDDRVSFIPLALRTYEGVYYEVDVNDTDGDGDTTDYVPVTKYTPTYTYNGTSYTVKPVDEVQLLRTMEMLYEYSMKNSVNLFEKLGAYIYWVDEFSGNYKETATAEYVFKQLDGWFEKCKTHLNEYAVDGATASAILKAQILETVANIQVFATAISPSGSMTTADTPFVVTPTIDKYHLESNSEYFKAWAEACYGEDAELWTYTCVNPSYPYSTYHLGDNLLSSRLLSWMMYEYDITGNLYWSVMYVKDSSDGSGVASETYITDMYANPLRSGEVNGDGYLIYPGSAYGVTGFLSSIRLHSIRDGIEDYNLLYALEQYAIARAAAKGESYDESGFDSVLHMLTELLYSGTQVKYEDGYLTNFANSREMLAELLVLAKNGIVLESSVTSGDTVTVTISAPEGVEFTVNGSVISTTENGYTTYTVTLSVAIDGSLNITTGSVDTEDSDSEEETLPVWSDLSDSSIIVNSSCWTITPTEAELAAVGAVSGATYRGIQGNANNFAYSVMRVLPTNTDSAYWEAYADYTLKFDWYYDLTTDGSDGVQYGVNVFGATRTLFEQCAWHTASVKVGDLLEKWSEATSTSLGSSVSVTRWLQFGWMSGVSDAYAGFAYFGNIRLEAPVDETEALNVTTTYFAEISTNATVDLTAIYTENGGTADISSGVTATLTSVYGEVIETDTPSNFDVTAVPQGAYSVVLKKGAMVLMNATVDVYTAADGLVWGDMARLAALTNLSDVMLLRNAAGEATDFTLGFAVTDGETYLTLSNAVGWNASRSIMLKALHSKAYYERMYDAGYTQITLTAKSSVSDGRFCANGTAPSSSAGNWIGASTTVKIPVSNLITNWDRLHDFTNLSEDNYAAELFFGAYVKNGSTSSFGNFGYIYEGTGDGLVTLTPELRASGAGGDATKALPNVSLSIPLTGGATFDATAWGSVETDKTNATYHTRNWSTYKNDRTSDYMSVKTLSESNVVGGRTEGLYYFIDPYESSLISSLNDYQYMHCFTLLASDKAAMESLLAECGDIELSFDVYFEIAGDSASGIRNCYVNGQVGNVGLQEGVWHTLSVKVSTLLENWDYLSNPNQTVGVAKACLFAIYGTYGEETNEVNYYIGNFKLVEP